MTDDKNLSSVACSVCRAKCHFEASGAKARNLQLTAANEIFPRWHKPPSAGCPPDGTGDVPSHSAPRTRLEMTFHST
jgi:hypothetical protein